MTTIATTDRPMTVREAARALGLSPVTIRRAYREGRLQGQRLGESDGWSFLMIDPASVEQYRHLHLGRHGPVSSRCLTCGRIRDRHAAEDHDFRADPRVAA